MHILLPVVVFIAFLAFAPKAAMLFAAWFVAVTSVVRESARRLVGAEVGWGDAARSVVLAAILPLLAMLVLGGFSAPAGSMLIGGPLILVLPLLAGSFVGAFMLALHTDFKASAIISVAALAASALLAWLIHAVS